MASYCVSFLTITGKKETLAAFDKQFCKSHTSYEREKYNALETEFNAVQYNYSKYIDVKFIPYVSTSNNETYIRINCIISETIATGYSFHNFIPITKDEYLSETEYNETEKEKWGDNKFCLKSKSHNGDEVLKYKFETGYKSPIKVIEEMSRQYAELVVQYTLVY